jgi:hypothetical protein
MLAEASALLILPPTCRAGLKRKGTCCMKLPPASRWWPTCLVTHLQDREIILSIRLHQALFFYDKHFVSSFLKFIVCFFNFY